MKKHLKRVLSVFLTIVVLFGALYIPDIKVDAYTINNNGTEGISIDINAYPYNQRWDYGAPYGSGGCTWFVGARVMQLTGKGRFMTYAPTKWWDWYGTSLGFTKGNVPKAPAVICYSGHVAMLEKILPDGRCVISEGGLTNDLGHAYKHNGSWYYVNPSQDGHTAIHTVQKADLYKSGFLGFIYLNGASAPASSQPVQQPTITVNQSNQSWAVSDHNIVPCAKIHNPYRAKVTTVGIQIKDGSNVIASKEEMMVAAGQNSTTSDVWFDCNKECGVTLRAGHTYTWQIYANVGGQKITTGWQTIKTTGTEAPPSAPSSVTVSKSDLGKGDVLDIAWAASPGATSYEVTVENTTDHSVPGVTKTLTGTKASLQLEKEGTYKVSVIAINAAGRSAAAVSKNCVVHPDVVVKYVDWDDTVLLTKNVKYGGSVTAPSAPSREGYTFQGWSDTATSVKKDTTIQANYTIKSYVVQFVDYAGNVISSERVNYGSAATPPTDVPAKDGFVFARWNSDKYLNVKEALKIEAVYVWENVNLPIITTIQSAVRNEESTGYDISLKMTNFPNDFTKGKIITALKTKDGKMVASETTSFSLKSSSEYSDTITVLYSGVASTVEVSMVGVVDDETTGTAKSKLVSKAIDIGNKWSDWSGDSAPTGDDIISETRTEYRYKERKTIKATSKPGTPVGYTYDSSASTGTYGDYGAWSGWGLSAVSGSTTRQTESRTVYRYAAWVCSNCGTHDPFGGTCSKCGTYTLNWNEFYGTSSGYNYSGGYQTSANWSGRGRIYYNGNYWYFELNGVNNGYTGTGQPSRVEYRYRDRKPYYNYYYWPTDYSEWQADKVEASADRKVESRTATRFKTNSTTVPVYNYKRYKYLNVNSGKYVYTYTSAYADSMEYPGEWEYKTAFSELKLHTTTADGIEVFNGVGEESWYKADLNQEGNRKTFQTTFSLEDTLGEKRNVKGKIPGAAGKVATLLVYKGTNSDPTASQIEYCGQTVIGEDGSYSIDYITKEEPSEKTGDFVITLGVEGATNYMVLGKIDAPKPYYSVEFLDRDGKTIGDIQTVREGDSATAPEVSEIEGYEFVGWDTGLSNVHDNLIVNAKYKKRKYTVVFVDWNNNAIAAKEFEYGEELAADSVPEKAGSKFKEWVNSKGNAVTTVTSDMIVTASYNDAVYTVTYLDFDGKELKSEEVSYGEAATRPEDPVSGDTNVLFAGWEMDGEDTCVTSDMLIRPKKSYAQTVETPEFSIEEGTYKKGQKVFLSTETDGATIYYYTLENEDADPGPLKKYTSAITLQEDTSIIAYAEAENYNRSDVAALTVTMEAESGEDKPTTPDTPSTPDTPEQPDETATNIIVESVKAKPGQDITVPIKITNNTGIAGFSFDLNYDSKALTLKEITTGDLLKDEKLSTNNNVVNWYGSDNITGDGYILNAVFTVASDAEEGTYPVKVSLHDGKKNLADEEGNYVEAKYITGQVNVVKGILGDLNKDESITIADVILLNRHILGKASLAADVLDYADINGDGDITISDVILLNRHVLGKTNILQKQEAGIATYSEENTQSDTHIYVEDTTFKPGETKNIPIKISGNPGIAGFAFTISMPDGYTLNSMTDAEMTSKGTFTSDSTKCTWYNSDNITSDGTLFTLNVTASKDASNGTIGVSLLDNKEGNLANEDGKTVKADLTGGKVSVEQKELSECDKNGHKVVKVPTMPATCTEDGLTGAKYCSVCEKILDAGTVIKAKGHVIVKDPAKAATAVSAGKTAGSHCSVCNKVIVPQKTIAKLKAKIKLSAKTKTIKRKKSYVLKVSGLAKGDYVKSVKSSSAKCAAVKKTKANQYKITGKKKGKANIKVVLASGKTAVCKITVK